MEQFGQVTASNLEAIFEALGVERKPLARLLVATVPLFRPSDAYGMRTLEISNKKIAEIAFGGQKQAAQRAVKAAVDSGVFAIVKKSGIKGQPSIYALGKGIQKDVCECIPNEEKEGIQGQARSCIPKSEIGIQNGPNRDTEPNTNMYPTQSYSYKARAEEEEEGEEMPPTLKEFCSYFKRRYPDIDAEGLYGIFEGDGWTDGNGEQIKYWRSYCDHKAKEWQGFEDAQKRAREAPKNDSRGMHATTKCPDCGQEVDGVGIGGELFNAACENCGYSFGFRRVW